jgi:MYXO-CTERM domain-containing protein
LFGCGNFYQFGDVDMQSGELKPTLDLRCAERIVECPGQEPMVAVCEPQAQQDFCHLSHWVLAPVCDVYDRGTELISYQMAQSFTCSGGFAVSKPDSSSAAGAAGSGTTGTVASDAGSTAGAAAPNVGTAGTASPATAGSSASPTPTASRQSSGGCSTLAEESGSESSALLTGAAGLALLTLRRRRRSV